MKKFMTITLAAAIMFAVAGQASAAALETKAEFRARYWYTDKYFQTINPKADNQVEWWDQRLRLFLTWPVADGVKLQVRTDILETMWGAQEAFGNNAIFGSANQIDFDWVNMVVAIPSTPLTMTLGKQDVSWGPGVLANKDNRFRAKMAAKLDPVAVSLSWDKNAETLNGATLVNGVQNQADNDGVTLAVTAEAAGFKFGVLGLWSDDQTTSNIDKERFGGDAFAMGKAGPVDLSAEVAYITGKNKVTGGKDVDQSGLLAYVGAKFLAGPATIGAEVAYAQGDKPGTAKNEGALRFDYQSPFWSVILFNNFDLPGWESTYTGDLSVGNAVAGKVSAAVKVMPALTLYAAGIYGQRLQETAKGAGNDEALGEEFDVIAMYSMTENVGVNVGFAYLLPGDAYGDLDNAWGATAQFNLTF
ncbi:MAG TPA: alginate export family protein [bacterium]